jgi:ABC-type methionine transport system ATPase subunit
MGAGRKTFCIRVIVLHIGKLLHQCGVLTVFLYSREKVMAAISSGRAMDASLTLARRLDRVW